MTADPTLRAELLTLATNLRWAWHRPTSQLLEELADLADGGGRARRHNPRAVVTALDDATLARLGQDDAWRGRVRDLAEELAQACSAVPSSGAASSSSVAYFSAEFALADCLATYSGGLGVLAGDHLRSASDLGVPLVAIGLAYREGYFRQTIDAGGHQHAHPAPNDFATLPVHPVVNGQGDRVLVEVEFGDGRVRIQAWRVDVGRVHLYLLDTDLADNPTHLREITSQLYGGDERLRLRQEMVLGIGGVRLLAALGIEPRVHHLNEGHAALAGLERLGVHLRAAGSFDEALSRVREELVFTTHTPVPAGHDTFDGGLAYHHLGPLTEALGIPYDAAWALATAPGGERWNQTVLALRLAGRTNGVARLHGNVSREMFAYLWPERAVDDVPISHVTNGVHPTTWVGEDIAGLLDTHAPAWRDERDVGELSGIRAVDPEVLWAAHERARLRLVDAARERLAMQARREGGAPDGTGLDPHALTIGFARRFATYKRGTLLAHDLERLAGILGDDDRPVQILVAGKAHPADLAGQQLIADLVHHARDPRLAGRLVFLEGYDLELAGLLTSGCDVWLNTPLRPQEASGTSGMKAAMNGGLNLSVLDGWWDEAVADLAPSAEVGFGWVIGGTDVHPDRALQDSRDADALYRVLADQVIEVFHDRDAAGVPRRWVAMMQDAIALLSPRFSSHRMALDYLPRYARPAPARGN